MNTMPSFFLKRAFLIGFHVISFLVLIIKFQSVYALPYFDVLKYGAKPIKDSISTKAIQKAIDACHLAGGGRVYFQPGQYTSGMLVLKSNVTLYLEQGATLFASDQPSQYNKQSANYQADFQTDTPNQLFLVYANGANHIGLEGKGTIHGQAKREWAPLKMVDKFIEKETQLAKDAGIDMKRAYAMDPKVRLIFLENCQDVHVEGISVLESPDWNLHIGMSERVTIHNVYVASSLTEGVNSDGIDIDGCKDVKISDCTVITGDDAICLKSTNRFGVYKNCENIVVTNCTLVSTSTALKLGTESHGDFKHILFQNCTIRNSNRGLSIVVRDGANVSDVIFSNITIECNRKHFNWWGDADPIRFIVLKRNPDSRLGSIKNVLIHNIHAVGQGTSVIQGYEGGRIENITFSQVQLSLQKESSPDFRAKEILRIEGAKNISLNHVTLTLDTIQGQSPSWTSILSLKNVSLLRSDHLILDKPFETKMPIQLENVREATFESVEVRKQLKSWFHIKGDKTEKVWIQPFSFDKLGSVVQLSPDVSSKQVKVILH